MKRKLSILLAAALGAAMLLTACGNKSSEAATESSITFAEGEDPYVGQWDDLEHNAVLDIWIDDEGVYHGMATWMRSTNDVSFWDFEGTASKKELTLTSCSRDDVLYQDDGNDTETAVYEAATGAIKASGGTLTFTVDGDSDTAEWSFAPSSQPEIEPIEFSTEELDTE